MREERTEQSLDCFFGHTETADGLQLRLGLFRLDIAFGDGELVLELVNLVAVFRGLQGIGEIHVRLESGRAEGTLDSFGHKTLPRVVRFMPSL